MSKCGLLDIIELKNKANGLFHKRKFDDAWDEYQNAGFLARSIDLDDLNNNIDRLDENGPISEQDFMRLKAILFYNAATCWYNLGKYELWEHLNYLSISEDPEYPWALHRLVLLHEKAGNYKLALDSAYETQDTRLYPQDKEAHSVFSSTIAKLEDLVDRYGETNGDEKEKYQNDTDLLFDEAFDRITKMISDFKNQSQENNAQ